MRVTLDTNILISMALFPSKQGNQTLKAITTHHKLLLSSFVTNEFLDVIRRKFPHKLTDAEIFLSRLSFKLVVTPQNIDTSLFEIRDPNDYPVLYTAMIASADILITGDKDFTSMRSEIKSPEILTLAEFSEKYL